MTDTITLTDLMRTHLDPTCSGWGVEFERIRQEDASETLELLHLIKRDGIQHPVAIDKVGGIVVDGAKRIYVATLLGIRDIPVEFA